MMTLEDWLPADRQRELKPAPAPTVAQVRLQLRHSRRLYENARGETTSLRMAERLVNAWQPERMITQALQDLQGTDALSRYEALRFLQVCAPDKLPILGER